MFSHDMAQMIIRHILNISLMKNIVGTHKNCICKGILMDTHNIRVYGEGTESII